MKLPNTTKPDSAQDAFNRVWQHFVIEGNKKCTSGGANCVYRNARGEGCAVGIMLPDEIAKRLDKGMLPGICNVLPSDAEVADWFEHVPRTLLTALQRAHDDGSNFEQDLRSIAKSYRLTIPA